MLECSFLIPLRRDAEISDGKPHALAVWRWLEEKLFESFDGLTIVPGVYEGVWKSHRSKAKLGDQSKKYEIALPRKKVPALRAILRKACAAFAQQCLYLSVAGNVEFIETDDKNRRSSLR